MGQNQKSGAVKVSADAMPHKAFGEAIEIARKQIQKKPESVSAENFNALVALVVNELKENFPSLTREMLAHVPRAIHFAKKKTEEFNAQQAMRLTYVKAEISQKRPGLTLLRSNNFEGKVILKNGSVASPGLIARACNDLNSERNKLFYDFVYVDNDSDGIIAFQKHYRELFEKEFPGNSYMDVKRLPEFMFYESRPLPKQSEQIVKNLFYTIKEERRAVRNAALATEKAEKAEREWRFNAVIWVSQQVLVAHKGNKEFNKKATFKALVKERFEGVQLTEDVVKEGIERGLEINALKVSGGSFQKAVLIKKA